MVSLNVVQLLPALNGGGVERGTLEVAQELVRRGHRSIVISAGGRLVEELVDQGSEHLCWPVGSKSPFAMRWIWPLRRWLSEQRIDVLHVRSRMPAWIAWLAWRGMDPATRPHFITTVHGLYSVSAYSAIMTRGERVIAVSETVREYLQRNYPRLPPERISVIQRGVAPEAFPFGYRPGPEWLDVWYRQYPQLRGTQVLTLPGRLSRLKGHADFIELIARLRSGGWTGMGLVVGGIEPRRTGYFEEIRQLARSRGLDDAIVFAGHRADMREIYSVSTLVLSLSSKPESFGRTVLEALSLGTPVVGYNHGGVGEILGKIYPAGMTPLGDLDQLTARVKELMHAAPPLPGAPVFPLKRMLDQTVALYESICQSPGGAK
ncbi:MAG: glycosyltransferase [Methylococcus sp.]|nr:MAG: glycosyltransferase [Methylococcus sp.]